jgi:hypothetical protein
MGVARIGRPRGPSLGDAAWTLVKRAEAAEKSGDVETAKKLWWEAGDKLCTSMAHFAPMLRAKVVEAKKRLGIS